MVAVAVISIGIPSVQVEKVDTNNYVEPEPISEKIDAQAESVPPRRLLRRLLVW